MQTYVVDDESILKIGRQSLIRSFVEERRGKKVVGTYCKNPFGCSGIVFMAEDSNNTEAFVHYVELHFVLLVIYLHMLLLLVKCFRYGKKKAGFWKLMVVKKTLRQGS